MTSSPGLRGWSRLQSKYSPPWCYRTTDDDDDRRQRAKQYWPSTLCVGGPVIILLQSAAVLAAVEYKTSEIVINRSAYFETIPFADLEPHRTQLMGWSTSSVASKPRPWFWQFRPSLHIEFSIDYTDDHRIPVSFRCSLQFNLCVLYTVYSTAVALFLLLQLCHTVNWKYLCLTVSFYVWSWWFIFLLLKINVAKVG